MQQTTSFGAPNELTEYRTMLRDTVRRLLGTEWKGGNDAGEIRAIWNRLHHQGLTVLGQDPATDSLPDILIVMEELGRASCPAPFLAAALANLALGPDSPASSGMPLAFHFGESGGDGDAGHIVCEDGVVRGTMRFVEDMGVADALLAVADDGSLHIMSATASGLRARPTDGLARPPLFDVVADDVPAERHVLRPGSLPDLVLAARLGLAARAAGAARRGFEMAVEYAGSRHQFGQPIGSFQAIQHKLANSIILLDAAALQIAAAGDARTDNPAAWRLLAQSAIVFCGQTLRGVALETHHIFGAIGFAEEHEAARQFRRVHADVTRLGGAMRFRADFAELLLDHDGDALAIADEGGSDPASGIRREIRAWLADSWTDEDRKRSRETPFHQRNWNLEFAHRLGRDGWTTLSWPAAAGGQERTPLEQLAYTEELLRVDAPDGPLIVGSRIVGPEIIAHGTPELKANLLPALRDGTASVCLGYSEPEAGSDLASLRTRAEPDGTDFIINGQKIWTTQGDVATHMILAARTNPDPQVKHGGISLFLLPMNSPGITVRPTMAMYGHTYCNIFFDDVRVPASMMLGPLNGGWRILGNALASERVVMAAFATQVRDLLRRIIAEVKGRGLSGDRAVRDRIAGLAAEVQAAHQLALRSIMLSGGAYVPMVEAAMGKVYASELSQRLTEAAIDIFGAIATLGEDSPGVPAEGLVEQLLRRSIMMVVGGGTNEIQRTMIAVRGLHLPPARSAGR
ncbi:MAG: acyl-CoA dehydrogenase [Sphingomonadaceae bacterium]